MAKRGGEASRGEARRATSGGAARRGGVVRRGERRLQATTRRQRRRRSTRRGVGGRARRRRHRRGGGCRKRSACCTRTALLVSCASRRLVGRRGQLHPTAGGPRTTASAGPRHTTNTRTRCTGSCCWVVLLGRTGYCWVVRQRWSRLGRRRGRRAARIREGRDESTTVRGRASC